MSTISQISRAASWQRATGLPEFCRRHNIGKTKAYEEIKAKRLKALKCGKRTLIAEDAAEEWLRSLPVFGAAPAVTPRPRGGRRKSARRSLGGVL
jgi:excisionase family DNA binding protein